MTETKVVDDVYAKDRERASSALILLRSLYDLQPPNLTTFGELEKDACGPFGGFVVLKQMVNVLFQFNPEDERVKERGKFTFSHEDWSGVLNTLYVGTVKESSVGTTSVSFGNACEDILEDETKTLKKKVLVRLNCGTGGIKGQVCAWDVERGAHVAFEQKNDKTLNPNPNEMQLGPKYKPDGKVPRVPADEMQLFRKFIIALNAELETKLKVSLSDRDAVDVRAFMTGPGRTHYGFCADPEERRLMDADACAYFASVHELVYIRPWNNESYFMSQEDEARLEQVAAQEMYINLQRLGILKQLLFVTQAAGLGQGSTQWGSFQIALGLNALEKAHPINEDFPPKNQLLDIAQEFKSQLYNTNLAQEFYDAWTAPVPDRLQQIQSSEEEPVLRVIAIKSLFCNFYEKNKALQEVLVKLTDTLEADMEDGEDDNDVLGTEIIVNATKPAESPTTATDTTAERNSTPNVAATESFVSHGERITSAAASVAYSPLASQLGLIISLVGKMIEEIDDIDGGRLNRLEGIMNRMKVKSPTCPNAVVLHTSASSSSTSSSSTSSSSSSSSSASSSTLLSSSVSEMSLDDIQREHVYQMSLFYHSTTKSQLELLRSHLKNWQKWVKLTFPDTPPVFLLD